MQPSTKDLAVKVFDRFILELPADMAGHEESNAEGGRSFSMDREQQALFFHVAYGEWYRLSRPPSDRGERVPEVLVECRAHSPNFESLEQMELGVHYEATFVDILNWGVGILASAIARHGRWREFRPALDRELELAFGGYGLEGGISLSQAYLEDDYLSDDKEAMDKAYAKDTTHDWRAIPAVELESAFGGMSIFTYLDDRGWKYYLPAVMRAVLRNPNSECEFYTRISLLPGHQGGSVVIKAAWTVERAAAFLALTEDQGRVIAKYLSHISELEPDWFAEHRIEANQLKAWLSRFEV